MDSIVWYRRRILKAIDAHLNENDCRHSIIEILSSEINENNKKGWKALQADPTTGFTDSSEVNSGEAPTC